MTNINSISQPSIALLTDRHEIVELTSNLLLLIDGRDWDAATRLFADSVAVDYTSLNGGERQTLAAHDLIASWQTVLDHLDATQHLLGNHVVAVEGDRATCIANVQGTHLLSNSAGGPIWTVAGRYDFGLTRTPAGWRINALALSVQWATGNQHIMELASRRGAES
jgi:hypothetical protein